MSDITERLRSWAQNEEMIDQYFLDHGRDCLEAADEIERLRERIEELEREVQSLLDPNGWFAEADDE